MKFLKYIGSTHVSDSQFSRIDFVFRGGSNNFFIEGRGGGPNFTQYVEAVLRLIICTPIEIFGWYVLSFSVAARLWQHLIVKV